MKRTALGLIAATFATHYVVTLFWILVPLVQGGTVSFQAFIDAFTFRSLDISRLLRLFGSGLFLSGAIAFILHALQWRRPWQAAGIGLLIPTALNAGVLFEPMMRLDHILLVLADRAIEGAAAGWIYWVVAIRPQMQAMGVASSPASAAAEFSDTRVATTMKRQILGVIAATMTAPYLVVLFASSARRDLATNSYGWRPSPEDILIYGTFGLAVYGPPLLAAAGIFTAALTRLGWASLWTALLAGAITGSVFMAVLYPDRPIDTLIGAVSGAFCGWIYWTIATGGRPHASAATPLEIQDP